MKNIIKNAMILTVITLVSGLLLGFVYDITKAATYQEIKDYWLDNVKTNADANASKFYIVYIYVDYSFLYCWK